MEEAPKSESVSAQRRVFVKWILLNLSQDQDKETFSLSEENLAEDFKDGKILLHLMQVLTGKTIDVKFPATDNKLKVLESITKILQVIKDEGVRLTISADNIYDGDETLLMGMIWMLILKYQVGQKAQILEWIRTLLMEPVKNFDTNWRDGFLFCKLVSKLAKIEGSYPTGTDDESTIERLKFAFENGENLLGIKELLTPADVLGGYLDERSCLTYLSFYFNKYGSVQNNEYLDRIHELEEQLAHRDALLIKSQGEVQYLVKSSKALYGQLRDQKSATEKIQKTLEEFQLKLPFLQSQTQNSNMPPPSGEGVTLVMTSVEDIDRFWVHNAKATAKAMAAMQEIIRKSLVEFNGFEGLVDNDRFVLGFSDPHDAIAFTIHTQKALNDAKWPKALGPFFAQKPAEGKELEAESGQDDENKPNPDENAEPQLDYDTKLFAGLPVSFALHTGVCAYVNRNYSGPAERICKRLSGAARPGEILVSSSSWDGCKETVPADFEIVHSAAKNSLGNFEIAECDGGFGVLQFFSASLSKRASHYSEFKFLTPEEKVQLELKEKLAQLQQANTQLKSKLETTEQQVVKARDRAMELHKFLEQSRNEMRTTIGEQVQAAMAEVASLIAESQSLEDQLTHTRKQMDGSKEVMQNMREKLKSITAKNSELRMEVLEGIREQERLMAENARLLEILERKPKGFIKRLLQKPSKKHLKEPHSASAAPLVPQKSLETKKKPTGRKLSLSSDSITLHPNQAPSVPSKTSLSISEPEKKLEESVEKPKIKESKSGKEGKRLHEKSKSETKVFQQEVESHSIEKQDAEAKDASFKLRASKSSRKSKGKHRQGSRLEIPGVLVDSVEGESPRDPVKTSPKKPGTPK